MAVHTSANGNAKGTAAGRVAQEAGERINMPTDALAQGIERRVGAYFAACSRRDAGAIAACFAAGAVHYFPHRPPLVGGAAIGHLIVEDLGKRGGQYFIDKICSSVEQCAAAVEWSRTYHNSDRVLRGSEFYEFDPGSVLIREIRAYYAAAPGPAETQPGLVGFDYEGRGYKIVS
jgi:methyltransferase